MPVRLMMTSCQSSTDVIAIHGVDKDLFTLFKHYAVEPGALASFKADTSGALVGEKIARRYGWKIGQNVTLPELNGISFNVRGILTKRGSAEDFIIFTGRRFLQEADQDQGMSHFVLVKPKPGLEQSVVSKAIDALPLTVQTTSQPEEALVTTILDQLADLVRLSRGIMVIIVVVVLIAVGNAISMATRDRFREFGVLRTLGFPRGAIAGLVLGEGVFQALAGALIGCSVVQVLASANLVTPIATCALTMEFSVGPAQWAMVLAVVTLSAALGSLLPAWNAARLDIVEALRPEE